MLIRSTVTPYDKRNPQSYCFEGSSKPIDSIEFSKNNITVFKKETMEIFPPSLFLCNSREKLFHVLGGLQGVCCGS